MTPLSSAIVSLSALLFPWTARAATDLGGAAEIALDYEDPGAFRYAIVNFVQSILTFTTIFAVITIIIAGFYLIFSLGNDANKETAKKIIIFTIVGIVLIMLSKGIIYFIMNAIG